MVAMSAKVEAMEVAVVLEADLMGSMEGMMVEEGVAVVVRVEEETVAVVVVVVEKVVGERAEVAQAEVDRAAEA